MLFPDPLYSSSSGIGNIFEENVNMERVKSKYSWENQSVDDDVKHVRLISGLEEREALAVLFVRDELMKILSKKK